MSLKKERNHFTGLSNIDFRTNKDKQALEIFQPWLSKKHYGSMNDYRYKLPDNERNKYFNASKPINMQYNSLNDYPNPKILKSANFYAKNKIKINSKAIFTNDRIAQLDESVKGKEAYVGESTMIPEIYKIRDERKNKNKILSEELKNKLTRQNVLFKSASLDNKCLLRDNKSKISLEEKVDKDKIFKIHTKLKQKYAYARNIRKLFNDWDSSKSGEISLYDLHQIINSFQIPISYNETRALISISNKRGTDSLNFEEFQNFISTPDSPIPCKTNELNDSNDIRPHCKLQLSNIEYKDEDLYKQLTVKNSSNKIKKTILSNASKNKIDEINYLFDFMKSKKSLFINKINDIQNDSNNQNQNNSCLAEGNYCNFEMFKKVMNRFSLPIKYTNDNILNIVYHKYYDDSKDKMNYNKFLDDCTNKQEQNDFFYFQSGYLNLLSNKLEKIQNEKDKFNDYFIQCQKESKEMQTTYDEQMKEHYLKEKIANEIQGNANDISHYQPSCYMVNLFNKDYGKYRNELNEIEKSFHPLRSLINTNQRKTRFGASPDYDYDETKKDVMGDEKSAFYINETDRFNNKIKDDFVKKEKELKLSRNKISGLKKAQSFQKLQDICDNRQKFFDFGEVIGLEEKTQLLLDYEIMNRKHN